MLKGRIDHLLFCDIRCVPQGWRELRVLRKAVAEHGLPEPSFFLGDALTAMECLLPVDVFFLRRDSGGEGGSALNLLGTGRLPAVLNIVKPTGLLVTDDRNGSHWFQRLVSGCLDEYRVSDRALRLAASQPWIAQNMYSFTVERWA
jgi:hypothetical protein